MNIPNTSKALFASVMLLGLSFAPQQAIAGKDSNTLNIVWGAAGPVENVDLYFSTRRTTMELAQGIFDTLVYREPSDFSYKPLLATAWRQVDDLTLEFDLRKGVTFHNGDPFTAEDVAYTLNWAANPDSKVRVPRNVDWIDRVVVIDPHKVQVISKEPFPAALDYLALSTPIYPAKYRQEVGLVGFQNNLVGTGPYKATNIETGKAYRLERNHDYFADSPKAGDLIEIIDIREVPDSQTQVAELLAGRADLIWNISADQADQIDALPNYTGVQVETMRVNFLALDAAGRSGHPAVRKKEVRHAIAHAVNRQSIVDNLVRGTARVLNAPCYERQFGCMTDVAHAYPYDVDKAKELMKEAGYEDGFDIDLYTVPNLQTVTEAIVADLAKIGVRANLRTMEYPALHALQMDGETPMYQLSWGSYSVNDVSALIGLFFGDNQEDYSGDTELHGWLSAAESTVDPEKRQELYSRAVDRITDNVYWLPISTAVRNYAYSDEVRFNAHPDELVRFFTVHWN